MIVQNDFLNKIKDFGLNSYEAKLWTAILSRGIATAGELSDIANVPRSRTYDVLESLEKKGFILMKIGKPIKYIAVNPSEVIDRVKKNIHEKFEKQQELMELLKKSEVLLELTALHKKGSELFEPTEVTGIIKGKKNIFYHLNSMIKSAEQSICFITNDYGLSKKAELLYSSLKKAKDNKIKIKIIAPVNKSSKEHIKQLSAISEIKNSAAINTLFCVVDAKSALLFTLNEDNNRNDDFGIWINTKFLAQGFESLFTHVWNTSKTTC